MVLINIIYFLINFFYDFFIIIIKIINFWTNNFRLPTLKIYFDMKILTDFGFFFFKVTINCLEKPFLAFKTSEFRGIHPEPSRNLYFPMNPQSETQVQLVAHVREKARLGKDVGGFAKLVLVFWVLCRCRDLVKAKIQFSINFSAHRVCCVFPLKKR